jgi:hypothetical protein
MYNAFKLSKMKRYVFIIVLLLIAFNGLYSQTVAVELDKMNVFYVGVENPITIVVENYPCDKIVVKPLFGTITKTLDNCHYYYKTDSCAFFNERIFVGVMLEDSIKWLDTLEYRVKRIPTPRLVIAGCPSGLMKKEKFIISAILTHGYDFDFGDIFTVINYSYEIWRNDSLICRETDIQGCMFTEKLKLEIESSQKGDKYYFFDVIAELSMNKCRRPLQSTEYEIE